MMRRLLNIVAAAALALSVAGLTTATQPDPSGFHQVWVCKYAGQPGDFEFLKPGKNPIIVDVAAADAYVGADFADGQTHSLVIDLATDANTGQGEKYIGDATCPTIPTPTEPTSTSTTTETPGATPTSTPTDQPSESPSITAAPSDPTTTPTQPSRPRPTQPNTAAGADLPEDVAASDGFRTFLLLLIGFIALSWLFGSYAEERERKAKVTRAFAERDNR